VQDLSSMLSSTAALVPDRPFFVGPDTSISYAGFEERVDRLATVLARHGASPGEPVGVLLPSTAELALSYWAVQRLGGVAVLLNPMYRELEIAGAVAAAGLKLLVTDVERAGRIGAAEAAALRLLRWDDAAEPLGAEAAAAPRFDTRVPRRLDDPVCMFLTSGTTGTPKAVVQSQLNQMTACATAFADYGLRFGAEVCLDTMPLFNNFGATGIMNVSIFAGATMVAPQRWDPDLALELIGRHSVTAVWGTPTIYVDLCERFDPNRHALTSVRRAFTAGAPAPEALIERFGSLTGTRLRQIYGATELTGPVTAEPLRGRTRPGTIGRVLGGTTVTILDDAGRPVPPGEVGEITVSGDMVSPGYLNNPRAQAESFTAAGWRSGDLGYLDEDDFLFLAGRKKEMIISGGNNIYPAEVESLISQHPSVATCTVIGLPDERRGEVPVAVVVRRAGSQDLATADLVEFCRARLSAYKVPRAVHFVTDLPLGPTGKVIRAELRARLVNDSTKQGE
jgi:long-chain acyl-CoA synthetase